MSVNNSNGCESATTLSQTAMRRLQRDLRAWEREREDLQIPVALGFGQDLSKIFINFKPYHGDFKDRVIHIHATFPADYPMSPPDVRMMTPGFIHPNVFENWYIQGEGAYICLDMIKPPSQYARPYAGWSSAYDLTGLILQLYSFLIGDDNIDQDYGGAVDRKAYAESGFGRLRAREARDNKAEFKCRCGFTDLPAPPPSSSSQQRSLPHGGSADRPTSERSPGDIQKPPTSQPQPVPELPNNVLALIIDHAGAGTATKIAEACTGGCSSRMSIDMMAGGGAAAAAAAAAGEGISSAGADDNLRDVALWVKQRQELVCFFNKTPAVGFIGTFDTSSGDSGSWNTKGEGDVLGFGVSVTRHQDGSLKDLSMAMDLLSYRAFCDGVRLSAWNVPFVEFMPLALNERHTAHALKILPVCVARMFRCTTSAVTDSHILEVLSRLMNSLVVEMVMVTEPKVKDHGSKHAQSVRSSVARHMSDAALKGFCHLHHLLLSVVLSGRSSGALIERCQRDVLRFVNGGEVERHKRRCPDLGLLMIKYVLVPKDVVPWSAFAPVFMRELLARQVLWVSRAEERGGKGATTFLTPWLTDDSSALAADIWRLQTHLQHSRTSLTTIAVEAFFVNALARPAGSGRTDALTATTTTQTRCPASGAVNAVVLSQLAAIKATYDKRNGEPPVAVFDAFSRHARSVLSLSKWTEVLAVLRLGLRPPPPRADDRPITVGDMAHQMADTLRQAVLDSRQARYHTDPLVQPSSVRASVMSPPKMYVDWSQLPPLGVISDNWQ